VPTPPARNADYTQAIMDLGATLCTRSRPACAICPLQQDCVAYGTQRQAELPARKPPASKARRVRRVVALVAVGQAGVWLEQRPAKGIWGGLWSLPEFADEAAAQEAHGFAKAAQLRRARLWGTVFHSFTHYDLELVPWVLPVKGQPQRAAPGLWYNGAPEMRLGLPAPVEKLLAALLAAGHESTEGDAE
jgi:A/G-specific adenine glycosylase